MKTLIINVKNVLIILILIKVVAFANATLILLENIMIFVISVMILIMEILVVRLQKDVLIIIKMID